MDFVLPEMIPSTRGTSVVDVAIAGEVEMVRLSVLLVTTDEGRVDDELLLVDEITEEVDETTDVVDEITEVVDAITDVEVLD